jgi:autotransporter-associated beta strand protein
VLGKDVTLTKQGTGTLTLGGSSDFGGVLSASAGRILVNGTVNGASDIKTALGAKVELGASYRFNLSTTLTLNGGTFSTGGYSEDLGTLTLSANSAIDLGSGASRFTLADSHTQSWFGTLNIQNWSGSPDGGGADQIYFGASSSALTTSQLAEIKFLNPEGYAPGTYAAQLLSTGELVAVVPEPGSFALLLGGAMMLGARRRRPGR